MICSAAFEWHMRAGHGGSSPRHQRGAHELAQSAAGRRSATRGRSGSAGDAHRPAHSVVRHRVSCSGAGAEPGFDDLRDLCSPRRSSARWWPVWHGLVAAHGMFGRRRREHRDWPTNWSRLLESHRRPDLDHRATVPDAASASDSSAERLPRSSGCRSASSISQRKTLRGGSLSHGSPLAVHYALRGAARWCLNMPGWQEDLQQASRMVRGAHPAVIAAIDYIHC